MTSNIGQLDKVISLDPFQVDLANKVLGQLNTYGQSALEVMTSGGKSYIAGYIMSGYMSKHRDAQILWLAPKSAIINVKNKIFQKTALRNRIHYIGYEELARGCDIDYELLSNVRLIVFDECHKAYAKKTYEHLVDVLDSISDADRLAMSATPIRYNGQDTFKILVPDVPEPVKFNITDAANHNLLPDLKYVLANMNISVGDFKSLERYGKLAQNDKDAQVLYNDVLDTLTKFQFNLQTDLGELLKNYINSTGEDGERHIAFLGSIAAIKEMKDDIELAFKSAYPNCTINMLEYHSGMTEEENKRAFQQFVVDEPEPGRIDVLLSVDKATESIHPDNVRSVLMFRGTQSVRVYLQQMGRGLMLKSYHPDDIIIFDFAENVSCISGQNYSSGYKHSGESGQNNGEQIDSIRSAIMRQFGYSKGLENQIGLKRIQVCLDKLKQITRLYTLKWLNSKLGYVKRVFNKLVELGASEPTENIYSMIYEVKQEGEIEYTLKLSQIWKKDRNAFNAFMDRLKYNFELYQKMFLSGEQPDNQQVTELFNQFGHSAYLTENNRLGTEKILKDIDYIKNEITKCGSIENSNNTHAKHKLKQLRLQYAKNLITPNICIYAERQGVDIAMYDLTLTDAQALCETDKDKEIASAFKSCIKPLTSLDKLIINGGDLDYYDWLSCKVKVTLTQRRYREAEMTCIYMSYINTNYGYILQGYKLNQTEIENGTKLISALFAIEDGKYPSKLEEDYIFNHSGMASMSDYEQQILKEFGVTKQKYSTLLEEKTEFMSVYDKALHGDAESIKKMLSYNRNSLDSKRKKLLNTTEFRQLKKDVKDTLGAEVLIKKAKMMCIQGEDYTKLRSELNDALNSGAIQQIDLALAPFRGYEVELAKKVIDSTPDEFKQMLEDSQVNSLSILITRCKDMASCSKEIISNIVKVRALDEQYKSRLNDIKKLIERK